VIDRGRVLVAEPWSDRQIDAERRRDQLAKAKHYGQPEVRPEPTQQTPTNDAEPGRVGLLTRLFRWVFGQR